MYVYCIYLRNRLRHRTHKRHSSPFIFDATVGEIWRYIQKKQKPSLQEREHMLHKAIVILRQWDQMYLDNDILYRTVIDPHQGQLKQLVQRWHCLQYSSIS
jgi:hypothetical protein